MISTRMDGAISRLPLRICRPNRKQPFGWQSGAKHLPSSGCGRIAQGWPQAKARFCRNQLSGSLSVQVTMDGGFTNFRNSSARFTIAGASADTDGNSSLAKTKQRRRISASFMVPLISARLAIRVRSYRKIGGAWRRATWREGQAARAQRKNAPLRGRKSNP